MSYVVGIFAIFKMFFDFFAAFNDLFLFFMMFLAYKQLSFCYAGIASIFAIFNSVYAVYSAGTILQEEEISESLGPVVFGLNMVSLAIYIAATVLLFYGYRHFKKAAMSNPQMMAANTGFPGRGMFGGAGGNGQNGQFAGRPGAGGYNPPRENNNNTMAQANQGFQAFRGQGIVVG